MQKVMSITTDNIIEIQEVDEITYETLSGAVNGLVELVSIDENVDMWLNEEGKLIGLEPNIIATLIWNKVFPNFDVIMGNVIITGGEDSDSNTLGLSDEAIDNIYALIHSGLEEAIERKLDN